MPAGASGILVAYSGGVDSSVLLHALAALRLDLPWPVRAIHVDHRLHADSAQWAAHCASTARTLGIALANRVVAVTDASEQGVEAAARKARYTALRAELQPGEVLLTAHHADDQAETLLLALMRGTGVRGLAGMPVVRPFGRGWHVRPLLPYRRAQLAAWAQARSVAWSDDPSNASTRFARNFLRSEILPRLAARWPAAIEHMQAAAGSLAESAQLLDELAQLDWQHCGIAGQIELPALRRLSDARQRNLLRWWLRERGARPPARATLAALRADIDSAAADRVPQIDVDGVRVFRHRDVLYAEPIARLDTSAGGSAWRWREPLPLGEGCGALRAVEVRGAGLAIARVPDTFEVRLRAGGERLRPAGARRHRTVKNLLQEADVLPWWRERLPMLYAGERLCAVADLWSDADVAASPEEMGVKIVWEGRPGIFSVEKRVAVSG